MLAINASDLATLIAAIAAGVVSIIVALRQNGSVANVRQIHEQVTPSNGKKLATIIEHNDLAGTVTEPPAPPES